MESFLVTFYLSFTQGLFSTGQMNLLHAKVATAVADGLDRFYALQVLVNDNLPFPEAIANGSVTIDQLKSTLLAAPVYGLQLQAYIPARYLGRFWGHFY